MFEYAPAPESKAIVSFEKSYGHFINGKFTKPGKTYKTINPATEEVLAEITHGTKKMSTLRSRLPTTHSTVLGQNSPEPNEANTSIESQGSCRSGPESLPLQRA